MSDLTSVFRLMSQGEMGGFAARLAEAWFVADSANRDRIETAFKDLIERAAKVYHLSA